MCIHIYIYIYICISPVEAAAGGVGCERGCKFRRWTRMFPPLLYIIISSIIIIHAILYDIILLLYYTRSPLEDSRLFGPSPWKTLAATNEKDISEQPSPWRESCKRESCYEDRVYPPVTTPVEGGSGGT